MRYKKNWSMMIFFKLCRQQGERRESARAADASDGCRGWGGQEREGQGDLDYDDDGHGVDVRPGPRAKVILSMVMMVMMSELMRAMELQQCIMQG